MHGTNVLIACPRCDALVSRHARKCPRCAHSRPGGGLTRGEFVIAFVGVTLLLGGLAALGVHVSKSATDGGRACATAVGASITSGEPQIHC